MLTQNSLSLKREKGIRLFLHRSCINHKQVALSKYHRDCFIKIFLTWNISFSGMQHNDWIYVYIVKWSPQSLITSIQYNLLPIVIIITDILTWKKHWKIKCLHDHFCCCCLLKLWVLLAEEKSGLSFGGGDSMKHPPWLFWRDPLLCFPFSKMF